MIGRFEEDYTSEKIKNWICQNSDPKYQKFASSLLPGITNVKGVKRPIIQHFAAQIAKGNWQSYLKIADDDSFEEIMLHGLVIALIKETALEKQQKLEQFIGKINNWSVCDSVCANIKQVKAERWKWWPWVKKYADSDDEFTVRFGVVMILSHFIAEDYLDEIFEVLNKNFSKHLNNKLISCVIGIDYGNIVVTKVGMHGLESDEEKENELDFVWVGNATNHASKYTDLAPGKTIFVSKSCYENLKSVDKYEWEKYARSKDGYTLRGYLLQNVYSLNAENLGKAYCPDEDVLREDNSIIESITELEKQYEVLIAREKDIAVKEADFIKERDQLQKTVQELSDRVDELSEDNENLSEQLNAVLSDYYDYLYKIIGSWHCSSSQYKEEFRKNSAWRYFIDEAYKIGAQKGISVDGVTDRYACGLMEIYMYYDEPEKAYNALLTMAKNNNYWINLRDDIVNWANKNNKLSTLIYAIEGRLDRYEIPLDKRQEFYGYTQKLRKIRGY